MFWNNAPSSLLPFDRYAVDFGSVRVPTNNLMSAIRMASERSRRLRAGVEITGPDGALVAVARCDADGVPVVYWRSHGLEYALSGMVAVGALGMVAICVAALLRLA